MIIVIQQIEVPAFQERPSAKSLFSMDLPVNYCGHSIQTGLSYFHPDAPALQVLAQHLSRTYLHTEIREKGGAYGAGCSLASDGTFTFQSFRDPHIRGKFLRIVNYVLFSKHYHSFVLHRYNSYHGTGCFMGFGQSYVATGVFSLFCVSFCFVSSL